MEPRLIVDLTTEDHDNNEIVFYLTFPGNYITSIGHRRDRKWSHPQVETRAKHATLVKSSMPLLAAHVLPASVILRSRAMPHDDGDDDVQMEERERERGKREGERECE